MNLSESSESCCYKSSQNIKYAECIWTRETCFNNLNKKTLANNFPNGLSEHGELILIGKTRSKLSSSNKITDQIGQAKKSLSKLEICHLNKVYQLDSFVLLNFLNPFSFEWCNYDSVFPSNALRIGYDTVNQCVMYVGRFVGKNFNSVGKINSSDYKLTTSIKQEIKIIDSKYQVLCLKPSPQSLKVLCRNKIRAILDHDNMKIDRLKNMIEETKILDFVKLKNNLKPGQCLNRNDGIQSANGKFRLFLDGKGDLKFYFNQNNDEYLYLYESVECLWFNDLKLVICFDNMKSMNFLGSFTNVNSIYTDGSKLKLCNNGCLDLVSITEEYKIVIQLRYDLESYVSSTKPKYDFSYCFAENEDYSSSGEEETDSDDESSDDDDDDENESDSDSDTD